MPRALKVFRYSDGFHAWTVAASSRAKALAAWGMSRDLFDQGLAEEVKGGPDHKAALDAPGEVIKRGLSVDVGKVEKAKPLKAKAGPSAKDRARVRALEAEREALERKAADLAKRQDRDRDALKTRLRAARAKLS